MKCRVIFWGSAEFAVPILGRLLKMPGFEIAAVVTKPDAPIGRHQLLAPSPVKSVAQQHGLKVLAPAKLKDPTFSDDLRDLNCDLGLVAAYGKIIPDHLLRLPVKGTLNIHPSLLPRWRGPSPIQATILAGDRETGVSLMLLDAEMDHGPIVAQIAVPLDGSETADHLEQKLAQVGADLLAAALTKYFSGQLTPKEQDHRKATFCPLLTRESGKIDWRKSAEEIERMSRAYEGWPEIWTEWISGAKKNRLKLFEAALGGPELSPGQMADFDGRLAVGTGRGTINFGALQLEGKKKMSLPELLRGLPAFLAGSLS